MKKNLLSLVLAVSYTLSFGQNVTDLNFTGCLAKTTFAQYSVNTTNNGTIATAGSSWISAIAAPTVDVSNIANMSLTLSSGATLVTAQSTNGAPVVTTTIPTNYTNSVQPLSGFTFSLTNYTGVYVANSAGTIYRGVNIFIHKLTQTSLPIKLTGGLVQPGFAQCGELANSSGGIPQLHTNGQSVYLAFNSEADSLKFSYENVGTGVKLAGALLLVEKSSDLSTWTTIQSIDVSLQPLSVSSSKIIPATYAISDPAARYIRIRVSGLQDSRASVNEKIRITSVMVKPVITWSQDFTALKTTDSPITLNASSPVSSSSTIPGNNIVYTSSNPAVVSVSGSTLTIVGVGTTTITASQANNNYYSKASVVKDVVVTDLGTGIHSVQSDAKLVYGFSKGIVSTINGTLQVYSTTGMLLKNQLVSKNQVIPMTTGAYIVRATVAGKLISQVIVL